VFCLLLVDSHFDTEEFVYEEDRFSCDFLTYVYYNVGLLLIGLL